MKFIFKKVEEAKKKELMFRSSVDSDGDFLIEASADGEDWWNVCFIDCEDGTVCRLCGIPSFLGLKTDICGRIEFS